MDTANPDLNTRLKQTKDGEAINSYYVSSHSSSQSVVPRKEDQGAFEVMAHNVNANHKLEKQSLFSYDSDHEAYRSENPLPSGERDYRKNMRRLNKAKHRRAAPQDQELEAIRLNGAD